MLSMSLIIKTTKYVTPPTIHIQFGMVPVVPASQTNLAINNAMNTMNAMNSLDCRELIAHVLRTRLVSLLPEFL